MTFQLKPGLKINDQGVVFDPTTGQSYSTNPTGDLIFNLLQEGLAEDQVFERINGTYQIERWRFNRYILDFKMVMESFNLLIHED